MVNVLTAVEDWEGVAGILEINSYNIMQECKASLAVFRCQWRKVVQEYCHREAPSDPCQIACDIAHVLESILQPPKKMQAKELKELLFGKC